MKTLKRSLLLLPTTILLLATRLFAQYFPPPPNPGQFGQQAQMMHMQHSQMQSMMNNSVRVAMEAATRRAAATAATSALAAGTTRRFEAYVDPAALARTTDTLATDFLTRSRPGMRVAIAPTILHSLEISARGYVVGQLLPDSLLEQIADAASQRISSFLVSRQNGKAGEVVILPWSETKSALSAYRPYSQALEREQLNALLAKLKADVVLVPRVVLLAAAMENTPEPTPEPHILERVYREATAPGLYLAISWSTYDSSSVQTGRYQASYHSAAGLLRIAKKDQMDKANPKHIDSKMYFALLEYFVAESKRNFPYRTAQLKKLQRK